jgi:hypothetical protein
MWVKLTDDWYEHQKFQRVSAAAELLYIRCLTWAARNMTDGFVPVRTILRLAPEGLGEALTNGDVDDQEFARGALTNELLDSGLWNRADGGVEIHDYTDYQPTRAQILAARKARQEGGREGARRRWQHLSQNSK